MLISRHQPARAGDIHDQDTTAGPCDACPFACLAAVLCVSSLGVDQLSVAATHRVFMGVLAPPDRAFSQPIVT